MTPVQTPIDVLSATCPLCCHAGTCCVNPVAGQRGWCAPCGSGPLRLRFIGNAVGALLVVLVVPVAILAVGAPVAFAARLVLSALGLL